MYDKQNDIDTFLALPIVKGDHVHVKGESIKDPNREEYVEVAKVDSENIYFYRYGYRELQSIKISEVRKYTSHIGVNPFQKEIRATAYQIDIEQLFWRCGFDRREKEERMEKWLGVPIPETTLNPAVVGEDGNDVEYQRGL